VSRRLDSREAVELRALRERRPELAGAIDLHLELLEIQRRVQGRIPLPAFDVSSDVFARHQASARALLQFDRIPLALTDLRLVLRQTADAMRRFGAIDDEQHLQVQAIGRDERLLDTLLQWYDMGHRSEAGASLESGGLVDQLLTLAMRPFLGRCADVLQPCESLGIWTHGHCPLCGGEPDFSVITTAAERLLICARCTLRWRFDPLACPYCANADRARITSFATADGQYRVYGCDACRRYLKAFDARRSGRPVLPVVDGVATLPLDAAAMQRGYSG
jgi:FdhE protein